MVKRPTPPGIHGQASRRRRAASEYGKQLAEKQRIKLMYVIRERQIKKYIKEAIASSGDTRENLMRRLEMRLDNVVFRLGWAKSRSMARQLVNHGHIFVNGKRVSIPSYEVKKEQTISMSPRIRKSNLTKDLSDLLKKYEAPVWLALDRQKIEAKVQGVPSAGELGNLNQVGMVIEYFSR